MTPVTLETARLILRPWRGRDTEPFVQMNADPKVCEFYPTEGFSRAESMALIARITYDMRQHGFGLWALELKNGGEFIGYTGLKHLRMNHPLAPNVEIGWRLAPAYWGRGYASEAATEALRYGLEELALPEVIAFTAIPNKRSMQVMERIGMERDPARDFTHPDVPAGHVLQPHVTYARQRKNNVV